MAASLEALAEEALKGGAEVQQELERKIEEALACPCVEDLREGPCGKQFSAAFACYIRNFKSDKVSHWTSIETDAHARLRHLARLYFDADHPEAFAEYGKAYQLPDNKADDRKPS